MSKRGLIILFALAAALRLGFIWIAPAWYDEAFQLVVSRLPFDRMLAAVAGDVHPPLWYLVVWPLGQLHAPIWALRIPAALFSLGSLWLFWRILQALNLSPRVQTAALVLMAIMPIQLYYALEARMYALLEFLVLTAVLAMLKGKWFWFTLASILMLYTQYYGVFYLAAIFIAGFIWHKNRSMRMLLFGCSGLATLAFAAWLPVLQIQMHTLTSSYWMQLTGPGMALRVLFDVLFMPPQNAVIQIPLMLAGFGWLVVALIYAFRNRNKSTGSMAMLAFLPFVFAILFSLVWQPVLHYRPLIAISPFLYILLAAPVDQLWWQFARSSKFNAYSFHGLNWRCVLLAAIFTLPLILICNISIYAGLRQNKASGSTVEMAYVQAYWQPGDIVYHYSDDSWVITTPYNDLPNYKAPDCAPTLGGLSPATRQAIGQKIIPLADLTYKRAWLFWSDSPLAPACARQQLIDLGLDPDRPLLLTENDEYVYEGLWMVKK